MTIDLIDKAILQFLYNAKRPLTGNQIAVKLGRSNANIQQRLEKLRRSGYVKKAKVGKMRTIGEVKSPSKIYWALNLK